MTVFGVLLTTYSVFVPCLGFYVYQKRGDRAFLDGLRYSALALLRSATWPLIFLSNAHGLSHAGVGSEGVHPGHQSGDRVMLPMEMEREQEQTSFLDTELDTSFLDTDDTSTSFLHTEGRDDPGLMAGDDDGGDDLPSSPSMLPKGGDKKGDKKSDKGGDKGGGDKGGKEDGESLADFAFEVIDPSSTALLDKQVFFVYSAVGQTGHRPFVYSAVGQTGIFVGRSSTLRLQRCWTNRYFCGRCRPRTFLRTIVPLSSIAVDGGHRPFVRIDPYPASL